VRVITTVGVSRVADRNLWSLVAREFPALRASEGPRRGDALLSLADWARDDFDLLAFDARVDALARDPRERGLFLAASSPGHAVHVEGVLTRCQRAFPRRNAASSTEEFGRALALHRKRHDVAKPLVAADLAHAYDTWQWLLRLSPGAGAPLQAAALLHDVERLATEADTRVEHLAPDHLAFKRAHARAGAEMARRILAEAGWAAADRDRAAALVAAHELPREGDAEGRLLADADALSFFSLNCPGYLAWFGAARTRVKVAYTLARLSPAARARLPRLRMPRAVAAMVEETAPTGAAERPVGAAAAGG
jgi:hypothetical protein